MNIKKYWFFSRVAYDSVTGEKLLEYSGSDTFTSEEGVSAVEVFESLMSDFESRRENLKIHCIQSYLNKKPRVCGAFLCASHAHIKESLSVVSLGNPLTLGCFAVRQAHV
ncbi:hypothetical protein GHT39_09565 [Citrobacter braakii]|uniref:hypothetical protein n=1 Tax=Citrobacter braakii TaxID=57706 RepID=UPI001906B612|nr:hypothetical protein [Citrobacter braakii]MBJ9225906.1 hypothetical protein [Citrobacter braakii]